MRKDLPEAAAAVVAGEVEEEEEEVVAEVVEEVVSYCGGVSNEDCSHIWFIQNTSLTFISLTYCPYCFIASIEEKI